MSAGFSQYGTIWAQWQIESSGRQLQVNLPGWIDALTAGHWRGVLINTSHVSQMYNSVKNSHDQVEKCIANTDIADLKRLSEVIKGDESADYIAAIQDWRVETAKFLSMVENVYPNGDFPDEAEDLTQPQVDAVLTQVQAIELAGR